MFSQIGLGWGFRSLLCSLDLGPTLNAKLVPVFVLSPVRGTDKDKSHDAEPSSPQVDRTSQ